MVQTDAPEAPAALPRKTREVRCHLIDSTVWNDFRFRDGDVIIDSWSKAGTTWTQQIVAQLVFGGAPDVDVAALCPWVDMRIVPPEVIASLDRQEHRRFLKTHLPVDALVFSPKARYLYLGRDGRDVVWSAFHHFATMRPERIAAINAKPGRVGPPLERPRGTAYDYWRDWFERDGHPLWPFWSHVRGWWAIRDLPNVRLLHFNELKRDLPGSIRSIAAFLGIELDEAAFPAILEHCSFAWMKAHAALLAPAGGVAWEGGAATFMNKGVNGRWTEVLSPEESAAYEARAVAELGPDCARWLMTGEMR